MKLIHDTLWTFLGNAVARLASGFFTIALARFIGLESYGAFALALAFAGIVAQFADFGIQQNYIKLVNECDQVLDRLKAASFWLRLLLAILACVVFSAVATFFVKDVYLHAVFLLVIPYVFGMAMFNLSQGILMAAHDMRAAAIQRITNTAVVIGLTALVLIVVGEQRNDQVVVNAAYGLSSLVAGTVAVINFSPYIFQSFDLVQARRLLIGAGGFFWTGMLYVVSPQVPLMILQAFANPLTLGAFAIVYRLPLVLYMVPMSVAQSFYPKLIASNREPLAYHRLVSIELACIVAIGSMMGLVLDFSAPWLLPLLVGVEESLALGLSAIFQLIVWILTLQSMSLPFAHVLMTTGFQGYRALVQGTGLLIAVIPYYVASLGDNLSLMAMTVVSIEGLALLAYAILVGRFINTSLVQMMTVRIVPYVTVLLVAKAGQYCLITFGYSELLQQLGLLLIAVITLGLVAIRQIKSTVIL